MLFALDAMDYFDATSCMQMIRHDPLLAVILAFMCSLALLLGQ